MQTVTPILNKSLVLIACFILTGTAMAQQNFRIVKGAFTEKIDAEVWINKVSGEKSTKIAEFKIYPTDRSFAFAVPDDSASNYSVRINFMNRSGHHPVIEKITTIPISLNAPQNYSLTISPSTLDPKKKLGWVLKKDDDKSSIVLLTGKVLNIKSPLLISLQRVEDGELVSENGFITNSAGIFAVPYLVKKPGYYYLTSMRWSVRVYLQPLEKLELNIDNATGSTTLIKGSATNQLLQSWSKLISPITSYGYNLSTFKDSINIDEYINTYKKLRPSMDEFMASFDFTDVELVNAIEDAMRIDRDLAPINFLFQASAKKVRGFRVTPTDFNEVPDFYKEFIQPSKFNSASILKVGEARQFMNLYARLNAALLAKEKKVRLSQAEKIRVMMNSIANDTLKSFLLNDQMWRMGATNLSEFKSRFEPFKEYAQKAPAREAYKSIYNQFSDDTAYIGKSAYDFSLPDTSGKMVSMKDFKGKVILIDVWATWCGPCKGEMPYLKTIEEEYRDNKEIVFVAISLDKAKDKEKWVRYIQKENLPGVHLLDDVGMAFGRKYKVNAIPRYLLIDRNGKWIEVRCPNPSSTEELKSYIEDALHQDSNTRNSDPKKNQSSNSR